MGWPLFCLTESKFMKKITRKELQKIEEELGDFAYYSKTKDPEEIECRKCVILMVVDALLTAGFKIWRVNL